MVREVEGDGVDDFLGFGEGVFRRGLDNLDGLGQAYMQDSFFTPPEKVFSYSGKRILIGRYKRTGQNFYMDVSEAFRALFLGMTRCLHGDTLIVCRRGLVPVRDVVHGDLVLSYDFLCGVKEWSPCLRYPSSSRELFSVFFVDGSVVRASLEHRFFVDTGGLVEECCLGDLEVGDSLLASANGLTPDSDGVLVERVVERIESFGVEESFDLHVPKNNNFFLGGGLLSHNSGKSFLLRGMADRAHEAGKAVVYLNDCKNEFHSSRKPLQSKFHKMLLDAEKPTKKPVMALRPSFFSKKDGGSPPPHNRWFSVHFMDMEEADFRTLIGSHAMTANQQNLVSLLWSRLKARFESDRDSFTLPGLMDVIDSLEEDVDSNQVRYFRDKFLPLLDSDFYVPEHNYNLVSAVKQGFIPAINMEGYDSFGRGNSFNYPVVFMNIVLRLLVDARIAGRLPELYVFIDELTRFVPSSYDNSFSTYLKESYDVHTRYGVSYAVATQQLDKTPEALVSQSKHIFLPANADVQDIASVLKRFGYSKTQTANNDASRLKQRMAKFEWLYFCKDNHRPEIIIPVSPLSHHMETSN